MLVKKTMTDFVDAYWWVKNHPVLDRNKLGISIDVYPVKVNPLTGEIDINDPYLNTKPEIWVETGWYMWDDDIKIVSHDWELDCGGDSYPEAILKLKEMVIKFYGDY